MQRITLQQGIRFRAAEIGSQLSANNYKKAFIISGISAGLVLVTGMILYRVTSPSPPQIEPKANAAAVIATSTEPSMPVASEMHIANNGLAFARGLRVTHISGGTIKATMTINSTDIDWEIQTTGLTKYYGHDGKRQTFDEIAVGDILDVTGRLSKGQSQFTITAEFVRE